MTISSWLNFGRPAPPGRGSAAGRNFSDSALPQPARSICVCLSAFLLRFVFRIRCRRFGAISLISSLINEIDFIFLIFVVTRRRLDTLMTADDLQSSLNLVLLTPPLGMLSARSSPIHESPSMKFVHGEPSTRGQFDTSCRVSPPFGQCRGA